MALRFLLVQFCVIWCLTVFGIDGQLIQQERFPTLFAGQFQTPRFVQRRPQMITGFVGPINQNQLLGSPSQQVQKVVVPVRLVNGQQQMEIDVNRLPQNVQAQLLRQQQQRQQQRQQQQLLAQIQQQKLRQEQQRLQMQQQMANHQPRLPAAPVIDPLSTLQGASTNQFNSNNVRNPQEVQNQQQFQGLQQQQFRGAQNQQFQGSQNQQQFQGPQNQQQFQGPQNNQQQFQGPQNNQQQFQGPQNNQQQFQRPQNNQQFQGQQNNQQFQGPQNQQFQGPQNQQLQGPQNNQQFQGPQNNQQFEGQQNNQQFQRPQNNQQFQEPQNNQQFQRPQNQQQFQESQNQQQFREPQNQAQLPNNFLRQQNSVQPQQDFNLLQQQQFRNNFIHNNGFSENEQMLRQQQQQNQLMQPPQQQQPNFTPFNAQNSNTQFNEFNDFVQPMPQNGPTNTVQRPNIEFGGFLPLTTSNASIDDIANEISSQPTFVIPITPSSTVLPITENTIQELAHTAKQLAFTSESKPDFTVGLNNLDTIVSSTAMPAVSTSSAPFKTSIFTKTSLPVTSQKPRKVKVGCEGGLGFCDVNDNYPKNRVAFLTSKCRDLISKMFVPLPDTFEETSNVSASVRQDEACSSEKRFLNPGFAVDDHGKWQVIIQTHEISQRVIIEMCRTPQHSCSGLTDSNTRSRCVQKFSFQLLMALDPERPDDCPAMRAVRVPTSCTCQIEAPRISI